MTLARLNCEACGSELVSAAPIGLYCPNKACTHDFDTAVVAVKAMHRMRALAEALKVTEVKALIEAARVVDEVANDMGWQEVYRGFDKLHSALAILRAMEGRDE